MAFVFALALSLAAFVQPAAAQADASDIIAVGEMAPDFMVTGATRYGVLQDPVRLSDLRGEVVVLAFFFRARTRG
jgi:peroxiredoxin Q/BCP